MQLLSKSLILLLLILFAISGPNLSIKPTIAQTIPTPSVPEFSLHLTEHPYDVLPLTTTDPYTGNNITTRVGYQVQNMSVELIITNQPFTPYKNSNDITISLYYNVSWKGHYENDWHTSLPHYPATNSSYTVLAFGINIPEYANFPAKKLGNFAIESQLDFRIEALIGYYTEKTVHLISDDTSSPLVVRDIFFGETSNWSNTQTVTIGETSTSTSPAPTAPTTSPMPTVTPIAPDTNSDSANLITLPLEIFVIIAAVVGLLAAALSALLYRTHTKTANLNQ